MKWMHSLEEVFPHDEVMLFFTARDRIFNWDINGIREEVNSHILGDEFTLEPLSDGLDRLESENSRDKLYENSLWAVSHTALTGTKASKKLASRLETQHYPINTSVIIYIEEYNDEKAKEIKEELKQRLGTNHNLRIGIGEEFLIGEASSYVYYRNPLTKPGVAPILVREWNNEVCQQLGIY